MDKEKLEKLYKKLEGMDEKKFEYVMDSIDAYDELEKSELLSKYSSLVKENIDKINEEDLAIKLEASTSELMERIADFESKKKKIVSFKGEKPVEGRDSQETDFLLMRDAESRIINAITIRAKHYGKIKEYCSVILDGIVALEENGVSLDPATEELVADVRGILTTVEARIQADLKQKAKYEGAASVVAPSPYAEKPEEKSGKKPEEKAEEVEESKEEISNYDAIMDADKKYHYFENLIAVGKTKEELEEILNNPSEHAEEIKNYKDKICAFIEKHEDKYKDVEGADSIKDLVSAVKVLNSVGLSVKETKDLEPEKGKKEKFVKKVVGIKQAGHNLLEKMGQHKVACIGAGIVIAVAVGAIINPALLPMALAYGGLGYGVNEVRKSFKK